MGTEYCIGNGRETRFSDHLSSLTSPHAERTDTRLWRSHIPIGSGNLRSTCSDDIVSRNFTFAARLLGTDEQVLQNLIDASIIARSVLVWQ